MQAHTVWYKDCKTDEERNKRLALLKSSRVFSQLLLDLLEERVLKNERPNFTEYDSPAWMYKLAHRNGQLEELEYLRQLLRPITSTNNDR